MVIQHNARNQDNSFGVFKNEAAGGGTRRVLRN